MGMEFEFYSRCNRKPMVSNKLNLWTGREKNKAMVDESRD